MKNLLKCAAISTAAMALLCATSGRVFALGSILYQAQDSNYVGLANSQYVPVGSLIELGMFSLSDSALSALAPGNQLTPASYATLLASFIPLTGGTSSGTMGTPNVSSAPGSFNIGFTGNNTSFQGQPTYLLIFNSSNTVSATQVGVFKGVNFPTDMLGGTVITDLDAALLPPVIGTYTANNPNPNIQNDNNNANAVINSFNLDTIIPEPSSITLVGLGILGAIGMIRRRRS